MASLQLMLIMLVFNFHISDGQNTCGHGCLCYNKILECSGKNFKQFPRFPNSVQRNTRKLFLRGMPLLELDHVLFNLDWPSLQLIDLKGEKAE